MLDWNDLRHFLAVAEHGSTIAAAKALSVNQSTVQRRIAVLSSKLGQPLMTRTPSGYALTAFGTSLLPHAQDVERAVKRLTSHAVTANDGSSGLIRITCPEPIVSRLTPLIERFQAENPALHVEFVISDRYLDLTKGDADVAFRSGDTDAELVGRKVANSVWAIYASHKYIARHGRPADLADLNSHTVITFDESMASHRVVAWLGSVAPNDKVAARTSSVLGLLQSVRSGIGLAPLPANIADSDPDLVRLFGPVAALQRTWKLLTTKALRREPRIAAFFGFIDEQRNAVRAILN